MKDKGILQKACDKVGLNLSTRKYTTGEDRWNVHRQTRGGEPPEVDFSGTEQSVMTFVLGYQAAFLAGKVEKTDVTKRILEVLQAANQ